MVSIQKRLAQSQRDRAANALALAQLEEADRILLRDALDNFVTIRTPVEEYANKKVRGMGYELNSYRYAVAHAAQVKATEERIRRAKELKATI